MIVGAAKRAGGVHTIYPGGDVTQAPHALVIAVTEALKTLGYFELPSEDQPPVHIWGSSDRLDEWFKGVNQRRANPTKSRAMEAIEDAEDEYLDTEISDLRKV